MSLSFKVKAVYEYTSPHEDDLHFPSGQIITVTEEEDDDWYAGEYVDASGVKQEGIFPRNFVEKYEPTAPPRPVRQSRPKQAAPAAIPEPAREPTPEPEEPEPEPEIQSQPAPREQSPPPPAVAAVPAPKPAEVSPPAAPKPAPAASRSVPPPVTDKPSGGSFRDRIAAFNKAAPPVAPFKPGGLGSGGSSSFIKKPFVAPPPSKNAYVPPPREAPVAKVYRRDEDPEIAAKESENQEQAERAGLAASSTDADAEEQPKPTSLKERIALLQKQQAEQAARHAEAAQKKEKPKRPAKKRTESSHTQDGLEEGEPAAPERQDTEGSIGKASMDSVREEADAPRRRKSSRGSFAIPGIPHRVPVTDGNEADMSGAGYTTEEPEEMSTPRDDSEDKPTARAPLSRAPTAPMRQPDVGEEEGTAEEATSRAEEDEEDEAEEEEEDDDVDPEVRRREELRARMAKMSGGMGMHGMFGPPGGMPMPGMVPPKKKKTTSSSETRSGSQVTDDAPVARAPAVPMIPLPGLSRVRSPEELDEEDDEQTPIAKTRISSEAPEAEEAASERGAPPVPGGRPAPPPVPKESRPVPPPPTMIPNPSLGSESDDEMSESTHNLSLATPTAEAPRPPLRPSEAPGSPPAPPSKRASVLPEKAASISPPQTGSNKDKRMSRPPPPIPGAAISPPAPAPQSRAPPPPPPTGSLSRSSTDDHHASQQAHSDEEEVTEYDGDYDTDIASAVVHRDALKSHGTDDSFEDSSTGRAPMASPPSGPPPLPSIPAPAPPPRGAPPPLPSQPPPSRASVDVPRAAPPPPPPTKGSAPWEDDDNEYDPFRYSGVTAPSYSTPAKPAARDDDLYSSSPPRSFLPPLPSQERSAPPPPPPREAAPAIAPGVPPRGPPRQSLDVNRGPPPRRSTDLSRMSMDSGFVANDVDLGRNTFWWTQPKTLPPPFQGRKDILVESEESSSIGPDGKPTVVKDIYVLFQDYSQTIVRAQFNAQDPADVKLEQRHEPPPSRLRQDQLEQAHEQFGRRIHETVTGRKETVVGDGTPHGLVQELLRPFADAVPPVGTRAYGALVYANLANASTQQNDEIRPGDILTLRNAKFQGKHGAMHAKYSMEVGKPDHVGVVAEWDGTKKKVRAWEQGRESKKVKMESFKLDDLRSGEVKVWRVMPRSWVGWAGHH